MKAMAPGKLLLTGAYAVLEGAPALVVAVDRYAIADTALPPGPVAPEVRAAMNGADAPAIDVRALHAGEAKLGLGSSAAAVVAALGARAAERGADLASPDVRSEIFTTARRAHAAAQSGGSGVDIAASVYGGVLAYSLHEGDAVAQPVSLPDGLVVDAIWSGVSARTSDLRARVAALRARDATLYHARMRDLADASSRAAGAVGDLALFLEAAHAMSAALAALGHDADAPIVPEHFVRLGAVAAREGAAFFPSGAGGGDVGVFLGARAPSDAFLSLLRYAGMRPLAIGIDREGLRSVT